MKEAQKSDTVNYCIFNGFSIRPLCDDACPINIDPNVLVMLANGMISQLDNIEENKLLQVKGYSYALEALLAGNYQMVNKFRSGAFITACLSSHDYYRVCMPCNGILREMTYVLGDLFSVNILTV